MMQNVGLGDLCLHIVRLEDPESQEPAAVGVIARLGVSVFRGVKDRIAVGILNADVFGY